MRDGVAIDLVTQRFAYDLLGNVCRKDDRSYRYDGMTGCGTAGLDGGGSASASGPHRVAETVLDGGGSLFYYYDARGNQTVRGEPGTANDRAASYSADDLAYEIALGNGTRTRFWYGSDGCTSCDPDTLDLGFSNHSHGNGAFKVNSIDAKVYKDLYFGRRVSDQDRYRPSNADHDLLWGILSTQTGSKWYFKSGMPTMPLVSPKL